MHVSSGFLLLETVPGREGHVMELLSRFPGVTQRSCLFPATLAIRVEGHALDPIATELRRLEGVLATRVYKARHT